MIKTIKKLWKRYNNWCKRESYSRFFDEYILTTDEISIMGQMAQCYKVDPQKMVDLAISRNAWYWIDFKDMVHIVCRCSEQRLIQNGFNVSEIKFEDNAKITVDDIINCLKKESDEIWLLNGFEI